jgi:hypothetical protein
LALDFSQFLQMWRLGMWVGEEGDVLI